MGQTAASGTKAGESPHVMRRGEPVAVHSGIVDLWTSNLFT